jgi:heptosyltransferase-2
MWPLSDPRIAARSFRRIAVRVPNALGDQVLATPALSALRDRYPSARITMLGDARARMLYEGAPWFDDALVFPRRAPVLEQARALRRQRLDACVLLTSSLRSLLPAFLAGVRHRIGYRRNVRTPLLTAHWPRPGERSRDKAYPTKLFFLELVGRLGATGNPRMRLFLSDRGAGRLDERMARLGVAAGEPLLPMCVGSAFGPSKVWPPAYFAEVADLVSERHGALVIVVCGPGEAEIGRAVASSARRPLIDTSADPLPIDELKVLIARARVLLTNDTGPRHVAAALGVPVVCMIGPMDPVYTETDLDLQSVLREPVDCSPCNLEVCPIDHRCMTRILPARVAAEIERLWSGRAGTPGIESRD